MHQIHRWCTLQCPRLGRNSCHMREIWDVLQKWKDAWILWAESCHNGKYTLKVHRRNASHISLLFCINMSFTWDTRKKEKKVSKRVGEFFNFAFCTSSHKMNVSCLIIHVQHSLLIMFRLFCFSCIHSSSHPLIWAEKLSKEKHRRDFEDETTFDTARARPNNQHWARQWAYLHDFFCFSSHHLDSRLSISCS